MGCSSCGKNKLIQQKAFEVQNLSDPDRQNKVKTSRNIPSQNMIELRNKHNQEKSLSNDNSNND